MSKDIPQGGPVQWGRISHTPTSYLDPQQTMPDVRDNRRTIRALE